MALAKIGQKKHITWMTYERLENLWSKPRHLKSMALSRTYGEDKRKKSPE